MLNASYFPYTLHFAEPGGTSRGVLLEKPSWIIKVWDDGNCHVAGLGEISVIPGLSPDDLDTIEAKIAHVISDINSIRIDDDGYWSGFPAVRFGFEMALLDLQNGGQRVLFPSAFTQSKAGIDINGLVWMGDLETMRKRVYQKVKDGFTCIKLKIGAIDFKKELELIELVSREFENMEIRLDANGGFTPADALHKLDQLNLFPIHSIEQPIQPGQWQQMAELCQKSPVPIALDEELIGLEDIQQRENMLNIVKPQYIILKPSLIGGWHEAEKWIALAQKQHVGWWATSALEGNIGLNAIAQWAYAQKVILPQGLGTGKVFTNNFASPLEVIKGQLWYLAQDDWNFSHLPSSFIHF